MGNSTSLGVRRSGMYERMRVVFLSKCLLLMAALLLQGCRSRVVDFYGEGYLVVSDNEVGFYPCGGGRPFALAADSNIDIPLMYEKFLAYRPDGAYVAPLFMYMSAYDAAADAPRYGPDPVSADKVMRIANVRTLARHAAIGCGAAVDESG